VKLTVLTGLAIAWLLLIIALSLIAPLITPFSPIQPIDKPLQAPNGRSFLGTDALGRDLWTRLLYGARTSISASFLAACLTVLMGSISALIVSSFPGWPDRIILWLTNALLAIPGLLLAMLLVAGMGSGLNTVILAVGIGGIPGFLRISRTIFLQIQTHGYIQASQALGAGRVWTALFHILPNALSHLIALATIHIAWAFLGTTTLTFLGFAGDPSLPEWGAMLNAGRLHLMTVPHLALAPGMAISLTIMAIHHLGTWLSRANLPRE